MNNIIIQFYKQIDKFITRSKGCYLYDSDGKQYIDFESGDWAANLGHSNDRINQVIKNQIDLSIHDGLRFRNKVSEDLSTSLLEKLTIKQGKSVFINSGSEAVNLGITLAKNITGRKKVLKMDCSYLSAYGHGQITADNNNLISLPIDDFSSISRINFKDFAVFVFEPGSSWGLIKYPSREFITKVASEIKQSGGLLMSNEVTTGFGRTGKWFGFHHYDYIPDIVSTGKALGNGYPISCVSITKEIADLFNNSPFRYAQSHQNDPLGCAISLEVIKIIEEEGLIQQSYDKGQYFKDQLINLKTKHQSKIKEIRARGLMISLEFIDHVNSGEVYQQLLDKGIIVGQKENVLRFMPPLIIEHSQIDSLVDALDEIITGT